MYGFVIYTWPLLFLRIQLLKHKNSTRILHKTHLRIFINYPHVYFFTLEHFRCFYIFFFWLPYSLSIRLIAIGHSIKVIQRIPFCTVHWKSLVDNKSHYLLAVIILSILHSYKTALREYDSFCPKFLLSEMFKLSLNAFLLWGQFTSLLSLQLLGFVYLFAFPIYRIVFHLFTLF